MYFASRHGRPQTRTLGRESSPSAASRDTPPGKPQSWLFVHLRTAGSNSRGLTQAGEGNEQGQSSKIRRLEAAVFLAHGGLTSRKLAKIAGLADATEARTLIRQLNQKLDKQGRAYRVEEVAGGYQLLTRSEFAPWLRKISGSPLRQRLSQTALETLAIVAYRQPVQRATIEAIRGVGSSEILKQLLEQDLVKITGRSEELGRPYLYGTTRRFLQMFGLRSVDRLPRITWVNESQSDIQLRADVAVENPQSEDSAMTYNAVLEQLDPESSLQDQLDQSSVVAGPDSALQEPRASIDEDEDDNYFDDGEDDYADDDDFEDDEWDDDDDGDDEDDDDDDVDDMEEDGEWEEVDDDDGWVDDDDDDEDDDEDGGWEEDDDEDDDWD